MKGTVFTESEKKPATDWVYKAATTVQFGGNHTAYSFEKHLTNATPRTIGMFRWR